MDFIKPHLDMLKRASKPYADKSDIELINSIKKKRNNVALNALTVRYFNLIKRNTKTYFIGINKNEWDDLFQIGVLGFLKAIDKYYPSKKAKFSTFASIKIRFEIIGSIRKKMSKRLSKDKWKTYKDRKSVV